MAEAAETPHEQQAKKLLDVFSGYTSRWGELPRELIDHPAVHELLQSEPQTQIAFLRLLAERIMTVVAALRGDRDFCDGDWRSVGWRKDFPKVGAILARRLLRRKLPVAEPDVFFLLDRSADVGKIHTNGYDHLEGIVSLAERFVKGQGGSSRIKEAARRLADALSWSHDADDSKLRIRLENVAHGPLALPLQPGEPWSDALLGRLRQSSERQGAAWCGLLVYCADAKGATPSAKWLSTAREHISEVGWDEFCEYVGEILPLVGKPRTQPVHRVSQWGPDPNLMFSEIHVDLLKGLAWCCSLQEHAGIARALTALALSSYKKVPGVGPRAVRVGNACIWALGAMPGMEGVAQLAVLRARVKFGTAQKGIEKALSRTADRLGLPRDELDELAVPTYGLDEVGLRRDTIGECVAEICITSSASAELRWFKPDGKTLKSVPAAVRKDHAEELAELKQAAKDIQRMLPAQRERLDQLFLQQKTWPFETWRARYLDHPLIGHLARRLIWRFTRGEEISDAVFRDGAFFTHEDRVLDRPDADTVVSLWHPVDRPADEVLAWRRWLEAREVQQPFKQAHREVYVLTDAERETDVYSNRFAAHILRQHQFNALCAARGWKNQLRLLVDAEYPPATRDLPGWNLRAEFWVQGAGDEFGVDTNDTGTFYFVSTDQVRFYPIDAAGRIAHAYPGGGYATRGPEGSDTPIHLPAVPSLVFSEIMRDVDLFVGVASVGNDPNWADGGPRGQYREYWSGYAFGELSESGKTRRLVLERIVPRLKIADRCTVVHRFLVVRGSLRTYKIHVGSGNILMEPNDQYLCIVPGRFKGSGPADKIFLPFEGDQTLAVILSKALLLADDQKISDPTITQQIRTMR